MRSVCGRHYCLLPFLCHAVTSIWVSCTIVFGLLDNLASVGIIIRFDFNVHRVLSGCLLTISHSCSKTALPSIILFHTIVEGHCDIIIIILILMINIWKKVYFEKKNRINWNGDMFDYQYSFKYPISKWNNWLIPVDVNRLANLLFWSLQDFFLIPFYLCEYVIRAVCETSSKL